MNSTEIANIIENPSLCKTADKKDLEALVRKYPYAQTFPILLLKTLSLTKDLQFEEALNENAYRISDRMHLYYLIHEKVASSEEKVTSSELQVASFEEEVTSLELQVPSSADEVVGLEGEIASSEVAADSETIRMDYDALINEDFKFAKVEEMTFEPVRIQGLLEDVEEVESSELQVASLDGDILEVASSELQVASTDDVAQEVSSLDADVTEVSSSELQVASTDDVAQEVASLDADVTEVSSSELQVASTDDVAQEVASLDVDVTEVSSSELQVGSLDDVEDEADLEFVNEEMEQEEFSRGIALEFFDPTVDLSAQTLEEELGILVPSSFEQEKKYISLDLIEKRNDAVEDELTSNAISQSFHIALEDEMILEKKQPQAVVEKFEENPSQEKRSFTSWLHANEKSNSTQSEEAKLDRSLEIIDKFIQEEPKISRSVKSENLDEKKKTPFFKATEKAKESIEESIIPVSSTLAKIFEAQGNYPKAIHSYEQLMLLYPEKKTFFANQIKELQKKLNS